MRRALAGVLAVLALTAQAQPAPDTTPPADTPPPESTAPQPAAPLQERPPPAPAAGEAPSPESQRAPAAAATPPARAAAPRTPAARPAAPAATAPAAETSARDPELATLREAVARLQSELDAERAAALQPPAEDGAETLAQPVRGAWRWLLATAVLSLALGFLLGWRLLDRRIRRKYGGLRIY